jgi:protoporphyrinogen/coproporphyrinogen III oxidase
MRLAVVGGGIAGLAGARAARLQAEATGLELDITLFEASDRLGGKIRTEEVDGLPLEWGPDSFLASKPRGRDLAVQLGLERELRTTGPAARRTYLLGTEGLLALPSGLVMGVPTGIRAIVEAARVGILTPSGAARALVEPAVPGGVDLGTTTRSLARRRLGRQAARALIEPLVLGVFGAPADRIGAEWAFPWARGRRSLVAAAASRPRSEGAAFIGIVGGMSRLVEALTASLQDAEIALECGVRSIEPSNEGFGVAWEGGALDADAVLLAVPSPSAASLLEAVAPRSARHLASIEYAASAVILLRFAEASLGRPLDASGYLVAPGRGDVVAACSFLPAKWPHLAGGSGPWLRAVVVDPEALALPDEGLMHRAALEVGAAIGAHGGAEDLRMTRWPQALPVYGPGHRAAVRAARVAMPAKVALAGAYLDGVGIPDCARTGEQAASELVRSLSKG